MEKTWDVVFWISERAVNYVPSSWANEDKTLYKWPTGPSRPGQPSLAELIKNCQDITNNYRLFAAKCKKTVTSLQEAERYTSKGENGFSDLDSNADDAVSETASVSSAKSNAVMEDEQSTDEEGANAWLRPSFNMSNNVNVGTLLMGSTAVLNDDTFGELDNTLTSNEPQPNTHPGQKKLNQSQSDTQPIQLSNSEKYLVRMLSQLTHEVRELKGAINQLENRLIVSERGHGHNPRVGNSEQQDRILNVLPANSKEQLLELEALISTSQDSFKLLEDILYLVGGDNYKGAIYACMKKIMVTDVANLYSGQGKLHGGQKKDAFKDLRICAALMGAIRRRFPTTTESEFKDRVGTFLRTAKDRDGGRKRRKTNLNIV